MPLVATDLMSELRGRLGDPSQAELPDAQLERALDAAVREFSRYRPRKYAHTFETVPGVAEYDLPAGSIDAREFWVVPPLGLIPELWDPLQFLLTGIPDEMWEYLNDAQDLYTDGNAVWDSQVLLSDDGSTPPRVRLDPVPAIQATVFCQVEHPVTLADLSERDAELLLLYAEGDCLEYIGRKRSKSVTQIPTATGPLKLDSGWTLRDEGREMKREFRRRMGQTASFVAMG